MLRLAVLLATTALLAGTSAMRGGTAAEAPAPGPAAPEKTRFDVCDASYLFPVPLTAADAASLIAVNAADPATHAELWPQDAFKRMLELVVSDDAAITHPSGNTRRIALLPGFDDRANWKVAAFRVDPGAPGGHDTISSKFGSTPQLRLIVQPVTMENGAPKVHDFTAHLVYSFVKAPAAAAKGFLPVATPDKDKFRAILNDLNDLKAKAKAAGIDTQGVPLGVHPALKAGPAVPGFVDAVRAFLTKHVNPTNLFAMAFMGLDNGAPEPWIFFAAARQPDGSFVPSRVPAIGFKPAQMFTRQDGEPQIFPTPLPTNLNPITNFLATPLADRRGAATAALFPAGVDLNAPAVVNVASDGTAITDPGGLLNRDIPDLVANPQKSHFFSVDCLSCHTESTRRALLKIPPTSFQYQPPAGISGVDTAALPRKNWNVRNFGWFPDFFAAGATSPTVTMRAANETADCVEVINRDYFGN